MFYQVILGSLLVLAVIPSSSSVAIIAAAKLAWGGLSVMTEIAGIYSSTDDFLREHGVKDLEFSKKEEILLNKIDSVAKSVDKIDKQVQSAVAASIESLKQDIPSQVRLELRLDSLLEMTAYINYADSQLKEYLIPGRAIERHTLENFAQTAVSHNSDSVLSKLNSIHDILHPGKDQHNFFHDGILKLLRNVTQNGGSSLCHQSPYKTISNLYNSLQVCQLKGYNVVQYSWNLLKLYEKGNFTGELQLLRERYFRRMTEQVESLKEALQSADSSYWSCDPEHHREGETYIQLTRLFQGMLFEENVLNRGRSCSEECSNYKRTQQYEYGRYTIGVCVGDVVDCRYLDAAMSVCTSEMNLAYIMEEILTLSALGAITDQDLEDAVLIDYMDPRNAPENRNEKYGSFDIDELSERECLALFRFKKNDIEKLQGMLSSPEVVTTSQRYSVSEKIPRNIMIKLVEDLIEELVFNSIKLRQLRVSYNLDIKNIQSEGVFIC